MDTRIAGVMMWLPCVDGAWDRGVWGDKLGDKVTQNRRQPGGGSETIAFWPITDDDAAGKDPAGASSVLSGQFVRDWAVNGRKMTRLAGNDDFDGQVTLRGFWNDFTCRPRDYLIKIEKTPVLWMMATDDIVCGPLEFTQGIYDTMKCPKELCIIEGTHLPQYFGPGFVQAAEATLSFLKKYTKA
jgi:uncharacterized protein